jgi:hypothetical protein
MRFRDGFTVNDTAFMDEGVIYEIEIELANTCHTFLPGHRIRLDVTSSNYPRFNNNMNDGGDMYVEGDTLIATNQVFHETTNASYLELMVDNTTNTAINEKEKQLYIYPNVVTNGSVTFFNDEVQSYKIMDINGRIIIEENNFSNSIEIDNLNPGLYFVKALIKTGWFDLKIIVTD